MICNVNKVSQGLLNGRTFRVESLGENVDVRDCETVVELSRKEFGKYMEMAHCITTHKCQGSTLKGEITIHDTERMSRELLYTALTRLTSIDNLYVER